MRKCAFALLVLLPLSASYRAGELVEASYVRIVEHIMPSADVEAWRILVWRTTFWQGVMDANKEDKPVMLCAMNGHPFGCV